MISNSKLILYHTGFYEIKKPQIDYGRKNADFGQGFYLSPDSEFARKWSGERKDQSTYLNIYTLDTSELKIKALERGEEWYDYIMRNRRGQADIFSDYDVITGPVANDTIYNTWGFATSGFLSSAQSLELLKIGPEYTQTVIKTPLAADKLCWKESVIFTGEDLSRFRETVKKEEEIYIKELTELFNSL